jgi:tagatose-1,6-bisphosphate aldolase
MTSSSLSTSQLGVASRSTLPELLRPFATPNGAICALALDHREALRNALKRVGLPDVTDQFMLELKARIIDELGASATAVLLDAAALRHCRPTEVGLFMPLEAQGHESSGGGRLNRLLDDFGPADAEALGAHGCKLLLYYRGDHPSTAGDQLELATRVAERCHSRGLALVVEPKVYRLDDESQESYAQHFGEHVVAAAAAFAESGSDLLKLQFPGDASACHRVTAAAGSVPWTLLGGTDVNGHAFAEQLCAAVDAGACGFIAGRPIWGGALTLAAYKQGAWLREHALPLLQSLVDIADTHARRGR